MPVSIDDVLAEKTGGQPFIFMVMAYHAQYPLYRLVDQAVRTEFGIPCLRADHFETAGEDLRAKVHLLIQRAEAVIAEISTDSENVFYEVGYATAANKPPLLLIQDDWPTDVTDLKGLVKIQYRLNESGTKKLEDDIVKNLRGRLSSGVELLRTMLMAERADNNYIISSPKYPGPSSRVWGQVYDTKTFGDYQGILGLVSAFGCMFGTGRNVELISAQHCPPDTIAQPWNLYLIGSNKVNPTAQQVLEAVQCSVDLSTRWRFGPAPDSVRGVEDWTAALYQGDTPVLGRAVELPPAALGEIADPKESSVFVEDYGLVVRAPHPAHQGNGRLAMTIGGAHSLGTGAAGVAATRPDKIKAIRDKLPPGTLENKQSGFWVLVKGIAGEDYRLDPQNVHIVDAGPIGKRFSEDEVRRSPSYHVV